MTRLALVSEEVGELLRADLLARDGTAQVVQQDLQRVRHRRLAPGRHSPFAQGRSSGCAHTIDEREGAVSGAR